MSKGAAQPRNQGKSDASFERSLAAARDGGSDGLGPVLERYREYLLAIAMAEMPGALAGKIGASDIVQETLAKGYEHFGTFQGRSPEQLAGWLRQILLNHLANVHKSFSSQKRDTAREELADSRLVHQHGLTASQELVSREQQACFEQALSRLPEDLRRVIELRHRDNLTFAEIGHRIETSEDTARRLWGRAVQQLQCELKQDESRGP